MSELALPKLECVEQKDKFGRFVAEPLEKGFGTTLGNALRRVLLGNMRGTAITSIAIDGILHEFSTISGVKEDTTDFILNVKQVCIKSLAGRGGKLTLDVEGAKEIHASDIAPSTELEIANPEQYLATIDSPDGRLKAEFNVEMGRGYASAESNENMPIGTIPVDAIFTPVRDVNFTIEPVHIGRETSLERLYLDVWTDGTVTPADALHEAAAILASQFNIFTGCEASEVEEVTEGEIPLVHDEKYNMPVEQLDLSVRTMNCLRHAGISTVGEVISKGEKELLALRNFGMKSLTELREKLAKYDIAMDFEEEENESISE